MDDSKISLGFSQREKEFVNVKSHRMISDKQASYRGVDKDFTLKYGKC